jgi:uncharacterized protein YjbI with pentapeptide repeats
MDNSSQIFGVLIGGAISLLTVFVTHLLDQMRERQKSFLEMEKFRYQEQVKLEIENQRKSSEDKVKNIELARQYSKSMEKPTFNGMDFSGASLNGVDLRGVQMRGANLSKAHFRHSCLAHADLEGAICVDTDFEGADLQNANLKNSNLDGAVLTKAILDGARLEATIGHKLEISNT